MVAWLLTLALARAEELPEPPPLPRIAPGESRAQDLKRAGGVVAGTGAAIVMVGGVGGLVSAATVGPCNGDGVCGQEGAFGRIGVPVIVGVGGGLALTGVLMSTVGARLAPRRPGLALVVPAWVDDRPGIAVTGRF